MLVKKFEAKTMKDALELVKQNLGPEAIILSAKDNSKGFGLMGEKSVEVTAAVSDETLRKKRLAETKLRETQKEKYLRAPAKVQKQFINRVQQRAYAPPAAPAPKPIVERRTPQLAQVSTTRYIDILDDANDGRTQTQRVRDAALRAQAATKSLSEAKPQMPTTMTASPKTSDVGALHTQISELKSIIENFSKVPQSFVQAHPGAEDGIPYELSPTFERLAKGGVQRSIIVDWLKTAKADLDREQIKKSPLVDAWLVQKVMTETLISREPMNARYHVFIGTTGQGKTTTLVKLASHLVMKERKRIALVSLDTIKLGATDQMKLYAQILNVPFACVRHPSEWKLLEEKVRDVHHILVDAPGINLKSMEELEWLRGLLPQNASRKVHFVQSALARDEECFEIASRYRVIGFDDVIFTRLDESVQHGLIVNFQHRFSVPLHSFGTGIRIPEDFEWATKEKVADLIFRISKPKRREVAS